MSWWRRVWVPVCARIIPRRVLRWWVRLGPAGEEFMEMHDRGIYLAEKKRAGGLGFEEYQELREIAAINLVYLQQAGFVIDPEMARICAEEIRKLEEELRDERENHAD